MRERTMCPKRTSAKWSDGQRDEVDTVSKTKGTGQPHEQCHHLSAARQDTRASRSQQHLPELDEDDVGGDRSAP